MSGENLVVAEPQMVKGSIAAGFRRRSSYFAKLCIHRNRSFPRDLGYDLGCGVFVTSYKDCVP